MTPLDPIKRSAPEIAEIKRWIATRDIAHENGIEALLRLSKKRSISDDTWGDLLAALPMEEGGQTSVFKDKMAERFGVDELAQAEFLNDGDLIADTVLSRACSEGRVAEGKFWASVFGADWNPYNGSYPLGWASSFPDLAQALIDRGADVNQRTPHTGDTPLFLALAEWAMADRRGEAFEPGQGPAESARRLLKAGARWGELSESERGLLGSLLGSEFVNKFAMETVGMLAHEVAENDPEGAALRMREFCSISQASPMEGFDWAAARKKVGSVIVAAKTKDPVGEEQLSEAFVAAIETLGSSPMSELENAKGSIFNTTLLGKAAASGSAAEAGFWADWMGVEWNVDSKETPKKVKESVRRPIEIAVEFKNAETLKELMGMGAPLAGLTADELTVVKALAGDKALDSIFEGLTQNFREASEESLVDGTLDAHEMASRGLVTPERWEALDAALKEAIDSKANFGYQLKAAKTLAAMPLTQRGAYPEGAAPVDVYDSYAQACRSGDITVARFYARALGPTMPANLANRSSPLVRALSGGQIETAKMLVEIAGSDPTETAALELVAREGRSREVCFLLSMGADPSSMSEQDARELFKVIEPQHFEELLEGWVNDLAQGERAPDAWAKAAASVLRLDAHEVFNESRYARLLGALDQSLAEASAPGRADLMKRAELLSVKTTATRGGSETPLQRAVKGGEENRALFWARLKGVEWASDQSQSPALLALRRPDAGIMVSILLREGLDPNAKIALSQNDHPDATNYVHRAIDLAKGDAALAFLKAGADPFGDSEALVERARALFRSKPEWAEAAQSLTLSGVSPAADRLAEEGSLPLSFAQRLVETGDLDRFWRLSSAFDWSGSTELFIEASDKAKASGIRAYAELKTALANDDLQSARDLIEGNLNLLPALAKRGIAEKTLLSAVGVGAAPLLEAFSKAGWPVTAALFKNADAAALSVARSGDASLLAKVASLCSEPLPVSRLAQEDLIIKAAFSGGERFVRQLESLVGGFDPAAVELAVESLSRSAPEAQAPSARALVSMAWERESVKAAELSSPEAARRLRHLTRVAGRMWAKLPDESRRSILLSAAESPHPSFFYSLDSTLPGDGGYEEYINAADAFAGMQAAEAFASESQEFLGKLLSRASDRNQQTLCHGAQLRSARSNDESLALLSTRQGKIPASLNAMTLAAASDSLGCLRVFLQSSEPGTLNGLGAILITSPELKSSQLSLEAMSMLVDSGAGIGSIEASLPEKGGGSISMSYLKNALNRLSLPPESEGRFGSSAWERSDDRLTAAQRYNIETLVGMSLARAYAPPSPERVALVLGERPDLVPFASDAALGSEEMMGKALAIDGHALKHASPILRANLTVCLKACSVTPDAAAHIHPALARGLELNLAPENRAEVVKKLGEALKSSQSLNPFSVMTRLAVGKAQEAALAQARVEISQRQKEQQVDFSVVYQALSGAGLTPDQDAATRSALATAHGMAQDKRLSLDDTDKMMLRRLWEKNIPDLLNKMAVIPQGERELAESGSLSPASVLIAGVNDSMSAMRAMRERSVARAKTALQAEGDVLADKALRKFESVVENAEILGSNPAVAQPAGPRM